MSRSRGDYRIFVGAFPSGDLAERIQALRAQYDPKTARITDPHVTIIGTYWRNGPATPENETETRARLRDVQSQIRPFELVLGGIHAFPPANRIIYLGVELTDGLLAARRALLEVIGPDKHRRFTPHLTLTMRLSKTKSQALLAQLQKREWHTGRWAMPISHLWLMQRGPDDPAWRYIQRLDLEDET
jgi:2'-5' RNA ligase